MFKAAPEKIGDSTYKMTNREFNTVKVVLPTQGVWHLERKKAIMKAHPEVQQLFGHDPRTAIFIIFFVSLITSLSIWCAPLPWWQQLVIGYTFGAWASFCGITLGHEAVHGLIFANDFLNKLFGIIAFTCSFLGPLAMFWQVEHIWHHSVVVDKVERFGPPGNSRVKKALIATFLYFAINIGFGVTSFLVFCVMFAHAVFYFLGRRPTLWPKEVNIPPFNRFPQTLNGWLFTNCAISYGYLAVLYFNYGIGPIIFQIMLTSICNGMHPFGFRNVQEHYALQKGQPTASVYAGWVNAFTFNIGYHVEHHDFNTIPCLRLPRLTEIAPEFYKTLPHYKSYTEAMIKFFSDDGIPLEAIFADNPLFKCE